MKKRVSFDWVPMIEKEKGWAVYLNPILGVLVGSADGWGTTNLGTLYRFTVGSMILM